MAAAATAHEIEPSVGRDAGILDPGTVVALWAPNAD